MRKLLGVILAVLVGRVAGREIRIRGEKIKRLEGGEPYRDAAVCNSYISPNGPDSNVNMVPLQNCAYFKGEVFSPIMGGLPTTCDTDPRGTGKCKKKAETAVCGTKRAVGSDGKCRFSSCDGTYAGNRAPCNLNGQCIGPKGCQEYLLKPRGGSVRVDGKAPKQAFQYNVGTYQIRYGTKGVDTCIWETRTCTEIGDTFKVSCTNYQDDNSNLGVPGDPCIRLLIIEDTSPPQVAPTFNQNKKPETYKQLTDSSDCNPPTDRAKEDVGCYDFFGLLGPYAPGYKVNLLDFWGGVKPEDKANCCGPNKDKPFYDVEPDERKKTVIHEGATKFQDPGVKIFDVVDGEMLYDENNICKRIDNPKAGQPGELECKVVGDPGKVCKVIAGGQKGKCTDELNFDLDKTGKQQILYFAMDASDNLGVVLRTVQINDGTPPTIKLFADTRLKLDTLYDDFITCKATGCSASPDFSTPKSEYSLMLKNLETPQTLKPRICRCSPDVEDERVANRNLFPVCEPNEPCITPEKIAASCPTEVTSRSTLLTNCANGELVDGKLVSSPKHKSGECMEQILWTPGGATCTNPANKKENECYEGRDRCEKTVTPAGIKYLDPGAEAFDSVKPKELEMDPKRVNGARKSTFDPQDLDHTLQTLRVHNSINVLPHKGPLPQEHTVTYMAVDAAGNEAEISRDVILEDLIAPKLQPLSENDEVEVEGGARFDDAFAIAEDFLDGDLTWDISLQVARTNNLVRRQECCQERTGGKCEPKLTGCVSDTRSVETRAPAGTIFKFTYSVKDRGNAAAAKLALRQVKIVDTTPPVIQVACSNEQLLADAQTGGYCIAVANGQWPVERGADWITIRDEILSDFTTASDNIDDHPWITKRVQISDCVGKWPDDTPRCVDTSQPAFTKFIINFDCDDFVGNSAKRVQLEIIIVDSDQPTITIDNGLTRTDPFKLEAMQVLDSAVNKVTASDKADGKYPFLSTASNPLRHASRVRALVTEKKLLECPSGEYLDAVEKKCKPLTICKSSEHESKAETKTSDRVCTTNSECLEPRLEINPPTSKSDRVCCACKTCGTQGERQILTENWAGALEFVEQCRPLFTKNPLSFDEVYALQEDEDPRKNVGVAVSKIFGSGYEEPTNTTSGLSLGLSLLVEGADNTHGIWAWRCCANSCPSSQPFTHFDLSPSSLQDAASSNNSATAKPGLLLKPACEIRFEPNEHFNTEIDGTGNPFDQSQRPTLTLRVWDMDRTVNGEDRTVYGGEVSLDIVGQLVDLKDVSFPNLNLDAPTSLFGETSYTIPLSVGSIEDEPRVLVSSEGQDVAHIAVFEIGGPPVSIVDKKVESFVFSPETVVNSIEVVLAIGGSGGNVDDGEEIIFTAPSSAAIEAAAPKRTRSEIRYRFTATGFTPDIAQFNELVDSFEYVHRNPTTPEEGGVPDREIRFTVNEDENGATYSYVELRPGEGRPYLDLDPQYPDVNKWVRWKSLKDGDSTALFTAVTLSEGSDKLDSDTLVAANLWIENAEPTDRLTLDEVTTVFCESCTEKVVNASARYLPLNGELRLRAETTLGEWQQVLRSIRYSGGVPRRIHVVVSNNHSDSLPATVIVSEFVVPWIDLNGDAPGNNLIERDGISFVQGQKDTVKLFKYTDQQRALVIKTDDRGGGYLKSAVVRITNAADCPSEILGLESDALRGTQLKKYSQTGSLTISGIADSATYARVLKQVLYFNQNPVPTQGARLIEIVVTDSKSGKESKPAIIILTVRTTNDPPVMFPREFQPRFAVPQDSRLADENEGVSTIDLVEAETAPVVASTERLSFKKCEPACTFSDATDRCLDAGLALCSRSAVEDLWSQGTTPGDVELGVRRGQPDALYWTKDTETFDPYSEFSLRENSKPIDIGQDDATVSESAYLLNVYPQALNPRFTLARQVDSKFSAGLRFGAVCCKPEQTKSAKATFNIDGVEGTVGFVQGSVDAATRISLSFKGLSQRAGAFKIYTLPVSPGKSTSKGYAGFDGSCGEIGPVYVETDTPSVLLNGAEDYYGSYLDETISLHGSRSVIGRSFGIFQNSQLWICATIVQTGGPATRLTAVLVNPQATGSFVSGSITFDQLEGDSQASLTVSGASGFGQSQIYDWSIAPPGATCLGLQRSNGGVFDPTGAARNGGRAMGDLYARAGPLRRDNGVGSADDAVYTVPALPLTGIQGVQGALLVIRANPQGPPVACGVIEVAAPTKLVHTVLAALGVEAFVTFGQNGPNDALKIGMRTDVLQRGTSISQDFEDTSDITQFRIAIHAFPVPPQIDISKNRDDPANWNVRCSDDEIGDEITTLEVDSTEKIPLFTGRSVRMTVKEGEDPVSLYGSDSIEGRSIVITSQNGNRRCASIGYAGGDVITAIGKFKDQNGYSGTITFRQGLQTGAGTSALVELENKKETRPKGWGITSGQEPCGCVASETTQCSVLEAPIRIDAVDGVSGVRVIDMTKSKQFFADLDGIDLHGVDSVVGQTLAIYSIAGGNSRPEDKANAIIKKVVGRSAKAEFASKGVYGTITLSQASAFDHVVVNVDVAAPSRLSDWQIIGGLVPRVFTEAATGEVGYDCEAVSTLYGGSFGDLPECSGILRRTPDQCPAGQLSAQLGGLQCNGASGWQCSYDESQATSLERHRSFTTSQISLFGKFSVMDKSLTLTMAPPGKSTCSSKDVKACGDAPECELYASRTEDVRCRRLKVCAPLAEEAPTTQLLGQFKEVNADDIAVVGSVGLKQLLDDPEGDVTLEARLSLNTESFVIEKPTASDLTIRSNGRKLKSCLRGVECVLDAGGSLPPLLTFEYNGQSGELSTVCTLGAAPKAGITEVVGLKVLRSPCFQWFLAETCPQKGDRTPVQRIFDFTQVVGAVLVPSAPRVSTALYTLPKFPFDSVTGLKIVVQGEGSNGLIACQDIQEYRSRVYFDPDEEGTTRASTRGVAITNVVAENGQMEYKRGIDAPWQPVPKDTSRSNALFLQASPENRVRFLIDDHYAGKITCKECPEIEGVANDDICVPCQLNRTAGALHFVAWDGSDGRPDGSIGDATIPFGQKAKALVSVSSDPTEVLFDVVPTVVDSSAVGARFEIEYSVRDDAGNVDVKSGEKAPVTRFTEIVDRTDPQLGLRGEFDLKIEGGVPYVDPGVFAYDEADMDITASVKVTDITVKASGSTRAPASDLKKECATISGTDPRRENCDKCVSDTEGGEATTGKGSIRQALVCDAYQKDPIATAANCPVLEQFGFSSTTEPNCRSDTEPKRVSTYKAEGTKYTITYEATDLQLRKATTQRTVEILDNVAPRVIPSLSPTEYEYIALEFTKDDTKKYTSDLRCPNELDCTKSWYHYSADEINDIGCFMSVDAIDGDLTCRARYTVRSFPPGDSSWYPGTPGARYGPVSRPDDPTCIGRVQYDVPSETNAKILVTEEQLDCSEEAVSVAALAQYDTAGLKLLDASADLGTRYLITYEVADLAGHTADVSLLYVVADTTAPDIRYGEQERHIPFAFPFTSAQRKADVTLEDVHDDCDLEGGICRVISVGEPVNTVVPGTYFISYIARDQLNNEKVYNRSIIVDEFILSLPTDREVVEMTLIIKRFSQSKFNTVEVRTAFHTAVVNTLARKQDDPPLEFLDPSLYQGDITDIQTTGNEIVGDFKVSFKVLVHCGAGNRTRNILNGEYGLAFAESLQEDMYLANAMPEESKIQITSPAEFVFNSESLCSENMVVVGAGVCPQRDLSAVPELVRANYEPRTDRGITSQLDCMTTCEMDNKCSFAAYDGSDTCIIYHGDSVNSCLPSQEVFRGYLTYRHGGQSYAFDEMLAAHSTFVLLYFTPKAPGKGWIVAVILPILIILIVLPLVIVRRRRLKEEEAEIDKLIAEAMEEYGQIGMGSAPPRKQGAYLPGASGRLDDIYGDGADDMRTKLNKARAGIGHWDKTPKFAEDPDAPALPTKAGADDDDMYQRDDAPPIPSKSGGSSQVPSQEAAKRLKSGKIPQKMFLHGALSRKDAEGLIKSAGLADGTFLVRTKGATFVLTMCMDSQFEHHVLAPNSGGTFDMNSKPLLRAQCPTLSDVIYHLSKDREEIATELALPITPAGYVFESNDPASSMLNRRASGTYGRDGKMQESAFLHGALSRLDAEEMITTSGLADGTFLVRTKGAKFVLSMCKDSQFEHHTLSRNLGTGIFEMNSKPLLRAQCSQLSEVVQHLSKDREEIATVLTKPVAPAHNLASSTDDAFGDAPPPVPSKPVARRASGRYGGETNLLEESAFLHGALSRSDAEDLISDAGLADGTFLVRTKGAKFVLTMCKDSQFEHHTLSRNSAGMFEMNSKPLLRAQCPTLPEVVQHLSNDREEIATVLTKPVTSIECSTDDAFGDAPPPVPSKPVARRASGRYGGESTLMTEEAFLHGQVSRTAAEDLISDAGLADGTFLVRTKGATFVLTMCKDSQFEHHVLSRNSAGIFEMNGKPMARAQCPTLSEVVQHLSNDREEIATVLTKPVAEESAIDF